MGLERQYLKFIEQAIDDAGYRRLARIGDLRIVELGNQVIRPSATGMTEARTGKEYFSRYGSHLSIDLNGLDGALALDLCEALPTWMLGLNHVVINSGVSEHVADHYACMANIHALCAPSGIMIHLVPRVGSWKDHGLRWYTPQFFCDVADEADYSVVDLQDIATRGPDSHLVAVVMRKSQGLKSDFMPRRLFGELWGKQQYRIVTGGEGV